MFLAVVGLLLLLVLFGVVDFRLMVDESLRGETDRRMIDDGLVDLVDLVVLVVLVAPVRDRVETDDVGGRLDDIW